MCQGLQEQQMSVGVVTSTAKHSGCRLDGLCSPPPHHHLGPPRSTPASGHWPHTAGRRRGKPSCARQPATSRSLARISRWGVHVQQHRSKGPLCSGYVAPHHHHHRPGAPLTRKTLVQRPPRRCCPAAALHPWPCRCSRRATTACQTTHTRPTRTRGRMRARALRRMCKRWRSGGLSTPEVWTACWLNPPLPSPCLFDSAAALAT